jgi:hypothetical protein
LQEQVAAAEVLTLEEHQAQFQEAVVLALRVVVLLVQMEQQIPVAVPEAAEVAQVMVVLAAQALC